MSRNIRPDELGPFDALEVHGVRDLGPARGLPAGDTWCEVDDAEPEFFSVYAHLAEGGVECLEDFATLAEAEAWAHAHAFGLPVGVYCRDARPPPQKRYRVSFTVRDCYTIDLAATSAEAAIARAQDIYEADGEEPFVFDLTNGGTDDWRAAEVPSSATADGRHVEIDEDAFLARFVPIPNHIADVERAFDGCLFETFGPELAFVRQMAASAPGRVWTIIEADGAMSIESGYHVVNRLGYLVTRHAADAACTISVVIEGQSADDARGTAP